MVVIYDNTLNVQFTHTHTHKVQNYRRYFIHIPIVIINKNFERKFLD